MKTKKPYISLVLKIWTLIFLLALPAINSIAQDVKAEFPGVQPKIANFNRPADGEILDVSTPGLCWWRAGDRDVVFYRTHLFSADGAKIHTSPMLDQTAYVPRVELIPGKYSWIVDAIDADGNVLASRAASDFEISTHAVSLPWIDAAELLGRVPESHPRLLFPEDQLSEIRKNLRTIHKETFSDLKTSADKALTLPLVKEPHFDTIVGRKNYAAKRTAYRIDYHAALETLTSAVWFLWL